MADQPTRDQQHPSAGETRQANWQVVGKLSLMVLLMFGFGYAMVPIYKAICEVTGVNFLTRAEPDNREFAENTQIDTSRKVNVEFDSNSRGAMQFKPEIAHAEVHPGQLFTVVYDLINTRPRRTAGQAIPSYAPLNSARYFKKVECFCFDQQMLEPNTTRQFQVVFVIDPELPKDINTITLSYTYFEVGGIALAPAGTVSPALIPGSPEMLPVPVVAKASRHG
ncbi:MAG: cytochrome c oxidase assembly protein [Burkholderiaceae bacterium]